MCVGISPPCSKCGAPARYKYELAASKKALTRILDAIDWITANMNDDCPARDELMKILGGSHGKMYQV